MIKWKGRVRCDCDLVRHCPDVKVLSKTTENERIVGVPGQDPNWTPPEYKSGGLPIEPTYL
jgi:hypothetical protein